MIEGESGWAVVLGVTGGTGGAVARALARDPGLNIFGVHRGHWKDEATAIERDVVGNDRRCHMFVHDAQSADHAAEGAAGLLDVAGRGNVKVLVHAIANASYGGFARDWQGRRFEPHKLESTFECMAHSFVYWVRQLYDRRILAPGARLIALTNPMVDSVVHGWGGVAAAKAALEMYVRHLGHELGPEGYRVILVKFGMVETRAIKIAFPDEEWSRVKGEIAGGTPAGRLSTVDEVGALVSYLAGPGGDWFTASTVDFSGGQTGALLDGIFNRSQEVRK
ncbi:MAG: SDR family oxidoreductase [Deltaproteobacteria bacterium]|nr:SDR family oxidoreductase [Deltaproteobacteria bacterium]